MADDLFIYGQWLQSVDLLLNGGICGERNVNPKINFSAIAIRRIDIGTGE